jgi:shikimate kinase
MNVEPGLSLILIGPIGAGKSTIGKLLAERLSLPRYSMDELRWAYYAETGYDEEKAGMLRSKQGVKALLAYWKPFEAHAVERLLADHRSGIIDMGAGHSVYEDETLFARVRNAMAPFPHIILLLPSPDVDESAATLRARLEQEFQNDNAQRLPAVLELNDHFLHHPSNARLATAVVYTNGKTPEETCEAILSLLTQSG